MNNAEFQAHTEEIERLVERVGQLEDEDARNSALELLQSVMDLQGAVLSRVVEVLSASEAGRNSLAKLGSDPLVCGQLVLFGIHPVALEGRVAKALENAAPQLRKQGGSVELLSVNDAVVKVKIHASGHGCGSSADALKTIIEQAILEVAPEVMEVVTDGVPASAPGFVPLNMLQPVPTEENNYEESPA
jgi:Fe-S cluster biogenesis protein NfuA